MALPSSWLTQSSWARVQAPVNVDSRSASGTRGLARMPPSSDTASSSSSATPSRVSSSRAAPAVPASCSRPTAAAVGLVPLRRIGATSTKPPSSRRRPATKRHDRLGIGQRLTQELIAQADEEGVVSTARRASSGLVVTPIGQAEALQGVGHALGPVGGTALEHVRAPGCLDHQAGIEQREEIDHGCLAGQAAAEKTRGPVANVQRQGVEHRQAAQAERGVIKVRIAFAAGKAAVGVLAGQQVGDLPPAQGRIDPGQPGADPGCQTLQIRFLVHVPAFRCENVPCGQWTTPPSRCQVPQFQPSPANYDCLGFFVRVLCE